MTNVVKDPAHLGGLIRQARKAQGKSQSALCDRAHINQPTVSILENGSPGARLETVLDVLAALDLEFVVRPRNAPAPAIVPAQMAQHATGLTTKKRVGRTPPTYRGYDRSARG